MLLGELIMVPPALEGDETTVIGKIASAAVIEVEPAGRWYEAYCHRRLHKHTLSHHSLSSSSEESSGELSEDEDDEGLMSTLDPKEWKDQDHYAVLGLSKLRYKATAEQIKRAYKKKVLKHHPDKRRARGLEVKEGEDDYFTCITRAIETLGNPSRRRAFDSVDPLFDDEVPPPQKENKEEFFNVFRPVFENNARWSSKRHVVELGTEADSQEHVDKFYSFWYEFESWREFSYLDEEEKEKGENRDERRWIDKQNKAARLKRKKEEFSRIRKLVDNAYNSDPRVAKFKEEEKEKKLAAKRAKQEAAQARVDEEERQKREVVEAEQRRKAEEEEAAKAQAAVEKKEREALKKVMKKERKTLRTMTKEFDYFVTDEGERVQIMTQVETLAEFLPVESLKALNVELTSGDKEKAKAAFLKQVEDYQKHLEEERKKHLNPQAHRSGASDSASKGKTPWSEEETQALIKAVNLFPAGTVQRWEAVSNFIEQHVQGAKGRPAKEVLAKAKGLQNLDASQSMREEVNKKAFDKFAKQHKVAAVESEVSERYDTVADIQISETGSNPAPWTADEQKRLEQALKTFPTSTADRWDRIAEILPGRSKKDCMKRYKELVEMVRAKKAAALAAAAKKK